jgi:branched-chain amino acid transport system substrate-binding protein
MKKIKIFIVLCFSFCISLAYAENLEQNKLINNFKIGVIVPLSGALSEYGLASKNGIEFAVLENPELFYNIKFVFEDSQWDPKTAVTAFNKLTTSDKVNLIYNWGNPTTEALSPLAESLKIPLLALSTDPKVAVGKQYVIRTVNRAEDFSKKLAYYLNQKKPKKIAIVLAENTYVMGLSEGLKQSLFSEIQVDTVGTFPIAEQDFKSSILKIKKNNYDFIGVFLISGQISSFYRQMKNAKLDLPTFGTDFFESSNEIKLSDGGMESAVYPHLAVNENFYKKYLEKFKNDYQVAYAGNAYDMAVIIGSLFSDLSKGVPNSREVITKLKSIKDFNGIGGNFSFQETEEAGSHYHYKATLKQVQQGKIRELLD